jgi:hypothetical protein
MKIRNIRSLISIIIISIFFGFTHIVFADAPALSGGSNVAGMNGTRIAITDLQITGASDPDLDIHLYVPSGTLSMDTITGLTFLDNVQTGSSLNFSGSLTDLNAALATLHFESVGSGSFELEATIVTAGAIYYPENGHVYEVVIGEDPISANAAKVAANARLFDDIPGYLATITTSSENDYISARLTSNGWIGASDAANEGDWKWIDGPEEGNSFWSGAAGGFAVNAQYANWNDGEPNNSDENEHCAEFIAGVGEKWNDLPCGDDFGNPRYSYVVEYGDGVDNPNVSFASLTITSVGENIFDGGFGTVESPFTISSCTQLQAMQDYLSSHFELTGDIDCSESSTWNINLDEFENGDSDEPLIPDSYSTDLNTDVVVTNNGYSGFQPVGDEETPFTGSFDGNGYTISDLWIFRKTTENVGLFGKVSSSTIQRVTMVDANIVGEDNTGALVGYAVSNSTIQNIQLENNMVRAYLAYYGGGLAGQVDESAISNIGNTGGTVHGSGSVIGGIVGSLANYSTIDNASSSAHVDGGYAVGGLIGNMSNSTTTNSHATGNVRTDRSEYNFVKTGYAAGGLVGNVNYSVIENSYATGDVETRGEQAGGFAGNVYQVNITNSYATGNVTGINTTIGGNTYIPATLGGFIGRLDGTSLVENSYTTGDVQTEGDNVGGFVGMSNCYVTVRRSYATGDAVGNDNVGGFVGSSSCEGPSTTFSVVFSEGSVRGNDYVGGFGGYLSTATINDAYTSAVTVIGSDYVGGFAGSMNYTDADNVYSRTNVIGSGESYIGGFAGYNFNDGEPIDALWDNTVESGLTSCGTPEGVDCDGVTGTTTVAMTTTLSTFEDRGYDFEDVWTMSPLNSGYPYFADMVPDDGFSEVLATLDPSNIIQTSVTLNARILNGQFNVYGFFMGTESHANNEELSQNTTESLNSLDALYPMSNGNGSFSIVDTPFDFSFGFEELACGTTYYYRSIVYAGVSEILDSEISNEQSFTTLACDTTSTPTPTPTPTLTQSWGGGGSSGLSTTEIQKIFGITQTTTPTNTSTTVGNTTINSSLFTRNLGTNKQLGTNLNGTDVQELQRFLNSQGFTVSTTGAGSLGKETTRFGPATRRALARFQKANNISPAVGYFGPVTRAKVLEVVKGR